MVTKIRVGGHTYELVQIRYSLRVKHSARRGSRVKVTSFAFGTSSGRNLGDVLQYALVNGQIFVGPYLNKPKDNSANLGAYLSQPFPPRP